MAPANPLNDEAYRARRVPRDYGVRGDYLRDQTAIIHSRPFRRLKHKTQVFFAPQNDHVCTRMEHVLHVATIAATICKGLNQRGWNLDLELATAIGLGHDVGHAPFGHAGERAITNILGNENSFCHEINSYRIVEHIVNYGQGLNLTYAVLDGIISHNGESFERIVTPEATWKDLDAINDRSHSPLTYEGCVVRLADKVAYLGRDIEDAVIANLIELTDVPPGVRRELGTKNGEIIDTLVEDVIQASAAENQVCLSEERHTLMRELAGFNYHFIYGHDRIRQYIRQCTQVIQRLFAHLAELHERNGKDYPAYDYTGLILDRHFGRYAKSLEAVYASEPTQVLVSDYIAGMTDDYALDAMRQISIPEPIEFIPLPTSS